MANLRHLGDRYFKCDSASETEDDNGYFCRFCPLCRQKLPADGFCINCDGYLCRTCYDNHLRPLATQHHTLLMQSQIPKRAGHAKADDVLQETCEKHGCQIVDLYCKRCDKVGCSTCIEENHGYCDTAYIPDYNKEKDLGGDLGGDLKFLSPFRGNQDIEKVQEYMWTVDLHSQNAHEQVKTYRKEINDTLDQIENNTHMKIDEKTNQALEMLQSYSTELKLTETKLRQYKTSAQTNSRAPDNKINKRFVNKKLFSETLTHYEEIKQKMENKLTKTTRFCFKQDDEVESNWKKMTTFGNICEAPERQQENITLKYIYSLSSGCFDKFFPLLAKISNCIIDNCIILTLEKMLLHVQGRNLGGTLLFLCDIEKEPTYSEQTFEHNAKFNIICVTDLHNYFKDMTKVSDKKVAITLHSVKKIQYLHVYDTKMELGSSIDVNGECCGIGCIEGKLFVSFTEPKKIEIIDLQGNVLKTVSYNKSKFHKDFQLKSPYFVASDPDRNLAYVLDKYNDCILVINVHGDITTIIWNSPYFYKTRMEGPIAAAVGEAREVYVAIDRPYSLQIISSNFLERDYLTVKGRTWEICSLACHQNKVYFGNRAGSFYVAEISTDRNY